MNDPEYANLEMVERSHWYYAGKRDIVRHWINRCRPLGLSDTLLDYGAGTGLFASEWLGQCQVRVFDSYPQSQEILRRRFPAGCVLTEIDMASTALDGKVACVTALDVLEHLADDARAVREFHRVLEPGGIAVITVPADMRLWSDWDESLLHFRRYDRSGLIALFDSSDWQLILCRYKNVVAYPAIYVMRRWRKVGQMGLGERRRVEDQIPPLWLNTLLRLTYVVPAKAARLRPPFGVSLLLVARRR